uniref:KorC n=1 Tax=Serratia proteamaculans (strain 568) TaxID=399741 RepID=A8GLQ4_SERP5
MSKAKEQLARESAIAEGLNPNTLLPFSSGWERPAGEDMRIILRMAGFTGSMAANYAGVEARQIRRWVAGEPPATYAGWCLLVVAAGLGYIPQ